MKHHVGISVGVVLLGIGVAPFWAARMAALPNTVAESTRITRSSGVQVASHTRPGDEFIPPLLGISDDEDVPAPPGNPMLALTGGYREPAVSPLLFEAEYLQRLPVAPALLLVGANDTPRLAPFPPASAGRPGPTARRAGKPGTKCSAWTELRLSTATRSGPRLLDAAYGCHDAHAADALSSSAGQFPTAGVANAAGRAGTRLRLASTYAEPNGPTTDGWPSLWRPGASAGWTTISRRSADAELR